MTVNVTAVNDAPAGTNKTVTTNEDTAYTFTAADFGFTDPNDSPANTLLGVKITTLPGAGSLTLNGVAVTAGQVISAANIASGLLRFTPVANANGTGYSSFSFQVQDNGGTANGGVDLDATPRTMTFNVTAVNDAPAGANRAVTTLENTAYVFASADFGFTDVSDSPANALLAVKITTVPGAGTLTLNGLTVNAGDFVLASDIAGGLLVFTPAAGVSGQPYANFTFQVQDNGGTANGGSDLDASANTMTVNVTSKVNQAPEGLSNTVITAEDVGYIFTNADFGFTDVNDTPSDQLLAVKITTIPGMGALMLNGVAVNAGDFVMASDIAAGSLVFMPGSNDHGSGYASFTFQVKDDGGTASGGADLDATPRTMTVDVTAVNDAPVGSDKTVTTSEDTGYTFGVADFGFADPNDSPGNTLLSVKITTLPGAGSLTLNGMAVNAGDFILASDIAAGKLVYTPVANGNGSGYASFTFQVQDNGGTANGGVDLDATPRTMTVDVTAVNDAPVGADNTVTAREDTAYTFGTADFGFADPNDAPANTLLSVKITTLPSAGTLTLNGVAINAGDFILASDIAAGKLVYTPVADGNGAGYANFTFQVQDNGGTANGGLNLDATPRTMALNVTAVNDAPVGTDHAVTTNEGTTRTFTVADFGFSDLRDAPGNAFWSARITTLPGAGTLTLNGAVVNAGDFVLTSDITSGQLVFTPLAGTSASTSFTFQVRDDGGTALAGSDTDAVARRMSIAVASASVPQGPSPTNSGTGSGSGSTTGSGTSPATPTQPTTPTAPPKDDAVDQIGDKLDDYSGGSPSPADNAALPPVQGRAESEGTGQGPSGQQASGGGYATSAANYAANQAGGFAFRLEAGGLNFGVTPGNILLEMSVNLVNSSSTPGLNLSFSPVGLHGSEHSAPSLVFTENTEDRRVKVEKMVVQTSGAALSVGAVWWAARMSGLLASLMISTPAWRSIDPLPVMGLGGGRGPDDEEDGDEHGDDPTGMDARAARLFGDNKAGNRELEGIG
ncbi:MAG: hypothetical protein H7225_16330 [Massilia sp.]|nr:hypothetical protein [Aquabacterium sp.]